MIKKIVETVKKETLAEARLNEIVTDLLTITLKAKDSPKKRIVVDKVKHNELARQVSGECIVLLKNENAILPLKSALKKIAIVGDFAKNPRYHGAGSSQVRPIQIINAINRTLKILSIAFFYCFLIFRALIAQE
ncbi:glycoside hydrolase family 3 C-terminal domain-containing protein [Flavobacterium sp. LB2P6]|uniref:glycoside hydrolase family 3 C-terminal domain-containing protein n=1 Tax=Flavobacterium sp. LB2P6 TaxID=3401714 RepID=UPI003AADCE25